jgi:transcriptional regulator with XRE-family HTH domain
MSTEHCQSRSSFLPNNADDLPQPLSRWHVDDMATIDRILKERERCGITVAELERRAGLAENRIHKWAQGTGEPNRPHLERIAAALGVPLDQLASDNPPPADPFRATLDALVQRHGTEACVRWILNGAAAQGTTVELVTPPPAAQSPKSSAG